LLKQLVAVDSSDGIGCDVTWRWRKLRASADESQEGAEPNAATLTRDIESRSSRLTPIATLLIESPQQHMRFELIA